MDREEMRELIAADSWAGKHEHVRETSPQPSVPQSSASSHAHDGVMEFEIPRWLIWAVAGTGVGLIVVWLYSTYKADQRAMAAYEAAGQAVSDYVRERIATQNLLRGKSDPVADPEPKHESDDEGTVLPGV